MPYTMWQTPNPNAQKHKLYSINCVEINPIKTSVIPKYLIVPMVYLLVFIQVNP